MCNLLEMDIPIVVELVDKGRKLIFDCLHLILNQAITSRIVRSCSDMSATEDLRDITHDTVAILRTSISDQSHNDTMSQNHPIYQRCDDRICMFIPKRNEFNPFS